MPGSLFRRKKSGFYVPLAEALADDEGMVLSRGHSSRGLALRVLAAHGVDLPIPLLKPTRASHTPTAPATRASTQ
jgi:hypothetical protein